MSNLKDTIVKIKTLEAEKISLLAEIEDLKRMADAKANALLNEIATLRDDLKSLKALMGQDKSQPSAEYIKENNNADTKEIVTKTVDASDKLGNQIFAVSPFSQYFDDWLVNLQQIITEFETNSSIKIDEQFVQDRSRILKVVEGELAQKRLDESTIGTVAKELDENKNLLLEANKEYDEKSKELSLKRDPEVERLTYRIHELERDMESQEESKSKMFKKRTAEKLAQTKQDMESAKQELEALQQKYASEQDKLRESYDKRKQEIMERGESMHKEIERLESDSSIEGRQAATKALDDAVNALIQRNSLMA